MVIGIAGLGRMGAAIGARLLEVGHQLVIWNRTAAKVKALADAGATVAASPSELASGVEAVITILIDAAAIDEVYGGPKGLLAGDVKGKLFIDMSTVRPATALALAVKVRAKGAAFAECPVGGSVGPARQGKLLGVMGAEAADAERAKPILAELCRRLDHAFYHLDGKRSRARGEDLGARRSGTSRDYSAAAKTGSIPSRIRSSAMLWLHTPRLRKKSQSHFQAPL